MADRRCVAVHERGFRCVFEVHPEKTPHYSSRAGHWGGKCDLCGLPFERSHEACAVAGDAQRRIIELEAERDKLHAALAWLSNQRGKLTEFVAPEYYWALWAVASIAHREHHDGTPAGRADALVRLWERVTGEVPNG